MKFEMVSTDRGERPMVWDGKRHLAKLSLSPDGRWLRITLVDRKPRKVKTFNTTTLETRAADLTAEEHTFDVEL